MKCFIFEKRYSHIFSKHEYYDDVINFAIHSLTKMLLTEDADIEFWDSDNYLTLSTLMLIQQLMEV
tara:strand:+ start:940 stop:1137 length:198 start_codon:yes stop_codon:yes gene_type:complete